MNMKWTKEKCMEVSHLFEKISDFEKKYRGAYMSARKNGWLEEITKHMKKMVSYTEKMCYEISLKFETKKKLCENNKYVYKKILKKKWTYMFSHMKNDNSEDDRCIYAYEFNDNSVYVGLTKNVKNRNNLHMKHGSVFEHIKICDDFKLKILTNYLPVYESRLKEDEYLNYYKNSGWNILNKIKTGGIGSCGNLNRISYWVKEKCQEESLKYKSRSEFQYNSGSAYNSAKKNKWLDEICSHMTPIRNHSGYWTKKRCQEESLKYKNKNQFQKNNSSAYMRSYKNGWLNEFYKN